MKRDKDGEEQEWRGTRMESNINGVEQGWSRT